ncbi:MAG: hypothetical protein IKS32_02900 [Solobacterium sp.]|nr:hypothetical protein [Solobacterium sp.]
MSENKELFRKKSMEQFTTPEQLNDYIRVSNPSIYLILFGVIVFLVSVVIWGMTGTINSHVTVHAIVDDGSLRAYIPEIQTADLKQTSTIMLNGIEYGISGISEPAKASSILTDEELVRCQLEPSEIVVTVTAGVEGLADGTYLADVIMVKMRPADLVLK